MYVYHSFLDNMFMILYDLSSTLHYGYVSLPHVKAYLVNKVQQTELRCYIFD